MIDVRQGPALRVVALMSIENVSGPGRQLTALATTLRDAGLDFRVVVFHRSGHPHPPLADHLAAHDIPHALMRDDGPLDLRMIRRVRDLARDWAPDVIQTHGYKASAIAWALRHTGSDVPWIGFFHGWTRESLRARFYHWLDRRLLASADIAVMMSERQRAEMPARARRVVVLYNAVVPIHEPADAPPISLPDRVPGEVRIGVVGRLSPEKGVDIFLEACAHLMRDSVGFVACIAGDGPERERLVALADRLGIRERLVFLGNVAAVHRLYRALDLVVLPSRSEGLPNVLLEALNEDVPVVATRVGAVPEVLRDPGAGWIVEPEAPSQLAAAIRDAIAEGRSERTRRARALTAARFSLEQRAEAHLELYREVLAHRRHRHDDRSAAGSGPAAA